MEFNGDKRKRTASTMLEYNKTYYKHVEEPPRITSIVNGSFKKSFTINGNDKFILPKPDSMFVKDNWEVEELQKIKTELNETKSKLNNYCFLEWHQHTSFRNKAKDIEWRVRKEFDPEFVTQAWCKFHEIVSKYPLVPKENIFRNNYKFLSLHLCEAPGAFITCLNHWLKTNLPTAQWNWLAMTFNPYYEGNSNVKMISDDRFIMHTLRNWYFGTDGTGNLMSLENLDGLVEKVKSRGKVNLITADGSVNCINNPGEQEGIVSSLHFCEVVAAMHVLEMGGNFLLKIFTTFEHQSICLLYFLSCVFKKIHFYKPVTSKEGNSEVYVICLEFKGSEFILPYLSVFRQEYGKNSCNAMFRKSDIPDQFIEQLVSCAEFFKNHQFSVIESNIAAYNLNDAATNFEVKKIAKLVADKYINDFSIQKLHIDLQIVGSLKLKRTKSNVWVVEPAAESFNERQKRQLLEPVYRLLMYVEQLKCLDPVTRVFHFKPISMSIETYINVGKPYLRIQSSRFCTVQVSEIYNLLFQAVDMEENIKLYLPTKDDLSKFQSLMQSCWGSTDKVLYFQYTDPCNNKQTISEILENLRKLQIGDNLVLIGFLLLTQFNVGLIYLLAHTFDNTEFTINEEVGCFITFKSYKHKDYILEKVREVYKILESASTNNTSVLSIISVTELYDSELYPVVVKLNNWIAKYCVQYIATTYNDSQ